MYKKKKDFLLGHSTHFQRVILNSANSRVLKTCSKDHHIFTKQPPHSPHKSFILKISNNK